MPMPNQLNWKNLMCLTAKPGWCLLFKLSSPHDKG